MTKKLLYLFSVICFSTLSWGQTVTLVGGFQGWNLGNGIPFTTTDNVNYTLANYTLPTNVEGVKFVVDNSWDNAYGFTTAPGFPTGTAVVPGTNIVPPAGTYNIAFNITSKEYSFTEGVNPNAVILLTGTAIPSTVTMTTTDGITYDAKSVTLTDGTLSFSQEGTENTWSSANFPSGTATSGGAGIDTPEGGTFNVTFNLETGVYAFTYTVVSMIGEGGPSGSWTVDSNLATTDGINYSLNNAVIVGGGMKFRDNALWTFQFGSSTTTPLTPFPAGTAVAGGPDLLTQSGTYYITFNRTTGAYNFGPALGVDDVAKKSFMVYPNPSNGIWNFAGQNTSIETIRIFDTLGKLVLESNPKSTTATMDASSLTKGMYFAQITAGNVSETIKLVKN